jgi:SNF2 family DNA or RNA helicase
LVFNWALELERFRPGLSVGLFQGKNRKLDPKTEVTLTSYSLLRLNPQVFQSLEWDIVVLDEAQTIKNPESQVAQAAFQLKSKFRLTLSGTPVENRLDELWSQLHFTNPGLLGGRSDFRDHFSEPIRAGQPGVAAQLRRKIAPFLLRRNKETVAPELPPRTDSVLYCDLSPEERELYNAVYASTQQQVIELLKRGGGVMQALEALLRLRQASCHSGLLPGQTAQTSAKFERLLTALEHAHADGHKVLVFSQWTRLLDLLEPHLGQAGIRFCRLDGNTRDREKVVREFQEPNGPETMLLSLKAGGTGLNLTAADHVFLLDLWWNPAVEQQAADRAHRIGQNRPVFVNRLVARDTVEERILKLQAHKRDLADAALGEADQAAGLTREDLLELLS